MRQTTVGVVYDRALFSVINEIGAVIDRAYNLMARACRLLLAVMCLLAMASPAFTAGNDLRLIDAIRSHDAAAVHALVKSRALVNATQGDGATALHWAVRYDDTDTVDLLLRSGARANAANDVGVTPL